MTRKMLTGYGWLALGSLCLKIPLALYIYEYGYLRGDHVLANPDAFAYVIHARNNDLDIRPLGHWLYDYLNECVYNLAPNHIPVYLVMVLLNVALSLLLPLALWPAVRGLGMDQETRPSYFFGLCALLLFWPSVLWLSAQNLKDILTALLFALFLSVFVSAVQPRRQRPFAFLGLMLAETILLYFIFSLRSYLAVFLLIAVVIHLLFKERYLLTKAFIVLAVVGILLSPAGQAALTFANSDQNWLINPAVVAEINQGQADLGLDPLVVNRTPTALLAAVPKMISPFPSIQWANVNEMLQVLRSVFLCFTVTFFAVSFWEWKAHLKWFFALCLLLPMMFYLIVPAYSGPRQFFSSGIDIVFLLLLPLFVLRGWRSRKMGVSLVAGLLVSNAGLLFTSKALF